MRARTKCPNCGEIVETDCEACITEDRLFHTCSEDGEPDVFEVKWEITEN